MGSTPNVAVLCSPAETTYFLDTKCTNFMRTIFYGFDRKAGNNLTGVGSLKSS